MNSSKKQKAQNLNDELDVLLVSLNNIESFITYLPKSQNPYLKTQEDFNRKKQSTYQNKPNPPSQQSTYQKNSYLSSQREQVYKDQQNLNNSQAIQILKSNASSTQQTNYESIKYSNASYSSNTPQNPEFNEKKGYIYKNLIFVLCALQDVQQTMNFFKSQDDKVYISISINRLILLINIAGKVLTDYEGENKFSLQYEQQKARLLFDEFFKQLAVPSHPKVEQCVIQFQKILSSEISNNIELLQVDEEKKQIQWQTDLNNNEFQSIINNFKPGQTIKQDIDKILQARKKSTQQSLERNFPQALNINIKYFSYFAS